MFFGNKDLLQYDIRNSKHGCNQNYVNNDMKYFLFQNNPPTIKFIITYNHKKFY